MSEYSQVQLYIECDEAQFTEIRDRFIQCLSEYGFERNYLQTYFGTIEWELSDNFFMYTGCNAKRTSLLKDNTSVSVWPALIGLTPHVFTELQQNVVELVLFFETDHIIDDYKSAHLKKEWQPLIWDTMCLFYKHFGETTIYFTDEATDGQPWEALISKQDQNKYWLFDAAIVPNQLETYNMQFSQSDFYTETRIEHTIFARKVVWDQPPWSHPNQYFPIK